MSTQVKEIRKNVNKNLTEIQIRGEMDFNLQPLFAATKEGYLAAWNNGPVSGWDAITSASNQASNLSVELQKSKITPIWNIEKPTDASELGTP
ncbi:MAG: hypothetical protein R3C03_03780 [Pirellulaceae bacterium]